MSTTTKCAHNGCAAQQTHLVRTVGGVRRTCATCAEEIANAIPERVRSVTALPTTNGATSMNYRTANQMSGAEFAAARDAMIASAS